MYECSGCGRRYPQSLPGCLFCDGSLSRMPEPAAARVLAVTDVANASTGHEDVPYSCVLLGHEDGSFALRKMDCGHEPGEVVASPEAGAEGRMTVGIVGSGVMGRGLTELLLARGYPVVWTGRSGERLRASADRVAERLVRVMDESEVTAARSRLTLSADPAALRVCDVVVEAVVEDFELKARALAEAEAAMRPDALLATNTSGLSIDDLSLKLRRPDRFGALHFFNPPTRMRLVETAPSLFTSREAAEALESFARELGKVPVRVAAKPAFVVNRVLMPLINEAVRVLEEGVAPPESIDEAVRLGLNHPMGPLALADLIGLDVVVRIMDNLVDRTGDAAYDARPLLRSHVDEGRLGRKSGEGFYRYERQRAVV